MGKLITLRPGPNRGPLLPSLRELRLSTGMGAPEFAAAIGDEAGEPVPTFVYLAYEDGEQPPWTIVGAAQRVAERRRRKTPGPSRRSSSSYLDVSIEVPAIAAAALFDGSSARELSPDEPAGHEFVAEIGRAIQQFVDIEMKLGSDALAPLAGRYLRAARRRLDAGQYDVSVERDLQAALAELVAWLLHDAGHQDAARNAAYEALHLARLAGSPEQLDLFILGNLAHVEIFTGRPGAALQIARAALGTNSLSSRLTAMFKIREARALAQLGDRAGTVRALASARSTLLDGVSATDPQWSWWLDEPELTHHRGQALASLGVHNRALALLQQANEDCPPNRVSGRFIYLAHSLDEAVHAHAWSDAEFILDQTLPYAEEVGSGRAAYVLREAASRLAQLPVRPNLRDAGRRLGAVLAAPASPTHAEGVDA